jgi:hypothetical protein
VGPLSEATFGVDGNEKLVVAARNATWFPTGDPFELLPVDAPHLLKRDRGDIPNVREDLGVRVDHLDWYEDVEPEADTIPARVTGTITGLGTDEDVLIAILVNGQIEAIVLSYHDRGRVGFQAMIPPGQFREGDNVLEVVPFEP